jgi:DNA-nicking Smr family endonuclease
VRPGEVDLHGLYVKEAIRYTDEAIEGAKRRGDAEVHLIVGKGLHSAGHVAKIKPAIAELMQKCALAASPRVGRR